jgi:hypothetical protein
VWAVFKIVIIPPLCTQTSWYASAECGKIKMHVETYTCKSLYGDEALGILRFSDTTQASDSLPLKF